MAAIHETLEWQGGIDGHLDLLDQTLLPAELVVLKLRTLYPLIDAIKRLALRGAPAIGCAAAYGMVIGVREAVADDSQSFDAAVESVGDRLDASRPTAVNLGWAVARLRERAGKEPSLDALLDEAHAIKKEDEDLCLRMGDAGAELIEDGMTVLTHCNAGRLATGGDGTALAVMFAAKRRGTNFHALADETRPLLQGVRLTALELAAEDIPVDVIADSAAAGLIARGVVDLIITGADRVAANGDVANKVGTYGLSLAAKEHNIPMYVVAPFSTFDFAIPDGSHIPIEERDPQEVLAIGGMSLAPEGVGARNPAFDVTPAAHLAGLVTDRGLITPVTTERIKEVLG